MLLNVFKINALSLFGSAIVNKTHDETRSALANPQVRDKLREQGFPPVGNTPAQFKAYLAAEIKAYAEMTRVAGIAPE